MEEKYSVSTKVQDTSSTFEPGTARLLLGLFDRLTTYLAKNNQKTSLSTGTITDDYQLPTEFSHIRTFFVKRNGIGIKRVLISNL